MTHKRAFILFLPFVAAIVFVFASCNKLSKTTESGVALPVTPDSVLLKSHVFVIDSTKLILVSSAAQLNDGIYAYTGNANLPGFVENDIIIGITGDGYLRKVTAVTRQQNEIVLNTTQAKLEDVFFQANINFTSGIDNLPSGNAFQYNVNNVSLYSDGVASCVLSAGNISITPGWNYNMQFQNGIMTGFSAICNNAMLSASLQMKVSSSASDNISASTVFNSVSGRNIVWIGQLPIVITTALTFNANVSGSVTGSIEHGLSMTNNDAFTLGDVYSSGSWQNKYNFSNNSTLAANASSAATLNLSCSIVPQMSVMIYGVLCPVASIAMNTSQVGVESTYTGNWNFSASLTQQPFISTSGGILGYSVPDNTNTWNTDTTNYTTPYKVVMISGNGQVGNAYEYLPQPLSVQVTDNNGNAQVGVPVYFTVTSGGGTLANYKVLTNTNGIAQANWIIGNPATATQSLQATVSTANGMQIIGSPLTFIAL